MFKNKKAVWTTIIILAIVVVVGGYYAYTTYFLPVEAETAETPEVQTADRD